MNECVLTVITTPELEERLVDWLLEAGREGFTTIPCRGHGLRPEHLSAAEQVAGRQHRVAFWLQLPESDAHSIVAQLSAEFGDAGLHYWITPVSAAGPIQAPVSRGTD